MNRIEKIAQKLLLFLGELYEKDGEEKSFDGSNLIDQLNLNSNEINDAVEELDDKGLIKRINYKSAPFTFGQVSINKNGRKEYYDLKNKTKSSSSMKVFISHSSADIEIAKRLIKLLRASMSLEPSEIRCTSVDGYKLPAGINTDETLKTEVHESLAFIGIITENSINSSYVLFELGARWGANLPMIPFICDQKGTSILSGPLKNINCLNHKTRGDLYSIIDSISETLGKEKLPTNSFLEEVDDLLNFKPEQMKKSSSTKAVNEESFIEEGSKKKEINSDNDIPEEIKDAIKANAKSKWKDDYEMVVHTIKDQFKSYKEYRNYSAPDIEKQELAIIIRNAEIKWPNDYEMIIHTVKEQVESRRELKNL